MRDLKSYPIPQQIKQFADTGGRRSMDALKETEYKLVTLLLFELYGGTLV